jgi:hypothetical protein
VPHYTGQAVTGLAGVVSGNRFPGAIGKGGLGHREAEASARPKLQAIATGKPHWEALQPGFREEAPPF